jgi:hypothetical protein
MNHRGITARHPTVAGWIWAAVCAHITDRPHVVYSIADIGTCIIAAQRPGIGLTATKTDIDIGV